MGSYAAICGVSMGLYAGLRFVETRVSRHRNSRAWGSSSTSKCDRSDPKILVRETLMVGLSVLVATKACSLASTYGSSIGHFSGRLGSIVHSMKGGGGGGSEPACGAAGGGGGGGGGAVPVSLGGFPVTN